MRRLSFRFRLALRCVQATSDGLGRHWAPEFLRLPFQFRTNPHEERPSHERAAPHIPPPSAPGAPLAHRGSRAAHRSTAVKSAACDRLRGPGCRLCGGLEPLEPCGRPRAPVAVTWARTGSHVSRFGLEHQAGGGHTIPARTSRRPGVQPPKRPRYAAIPRASRHRRQRSAAPRRPASRNRALPSAVRAPVDSPPCMRHLERTTTPPSSPRTTTTGARQACPSRHRAPHRGRSSFGGACSARTRRRARSASTKASFAAKRSRNRAAARTKAASLILRPMGTP